MKKIRSGVREALTDCNFLSGAIPRCCMQLSFFDGLSPTRHVRHRKQSWRIPICAVFFLACLFLSGVVFQARGTCLTNEGPFQITSIQRAANGEIILTWAPACTNFIFGVFSADDFLGTNTLWVGRMGMWGDASGAMSFTDTTASVSRRFFEALRILPTSISDWDADGIPDVWEADYGLNPFNASDAALDLDGDGVDNLTEFLQGRDPTKGAVADTGGLVNLDVFTPLE